MPPTKKESFVRFFKIFAHRVATSELTSTSVIIAYYVLLSLFPLLILVGNLMPFFQLNPASAIGYIQEIVPEVVLPVLEPIILDLLGHASGGLLSISGLAVLWAASRGISYLQNGMNRAYGIRQDRSYLRRHLVGFLVLLLVLMLIGAFLLVFSFSDMVLAALSPHTSWAASLREIIRSVKWPVTLFFMFCLLTIVYVITPSARVRIRDAMPGAALACLGLILLVQLFALYVRAGMGMFSSYGALSTFFVLMFWLNFSAMIVVIGAMLNASIQEFRFGADSVEVSRFDAIIDGPLRSRVKKLVAARRGKKKPKAQPGAANPAEGGQALPPESGPEKPEPPPQEEPPSPSP